MPTAWRFLYELPSHLFVSNLSGRQDSRRRDTLYNPMNTTASDSNNFGFISSSHKVEGETATVVIVDSAYPRKELYPLLSLLHRVQWSVGSHILCQATCRRLIRTQYCSALRLCLLFLIPGCFAFASCMSFTVAGRQC